MTINQRFVLPVRQRQRRRRLMLLFALTGFTLALFFFFARWPDSALTQAGEVPSRQELALDPQPQPIREKQVAGVIQPGETFSALLKEYLSAQQIHELAARSRDTFPLSKLRAGQPYNLCVKDDRLISILYEINREEQLSIRCVEDGFNIETLPIPYRIQNEVVHGTINSSLFEAVATSGEEAELAIALADIFAWDIDFIRDIQKGDHFSGLVEKRFREEQPAGYGQILAAEFNNNGKTFQAILFKDGAQPAGYYTPSGESLRKVFLKAPLNFTRISSGYTKRRFHPVLHIWKPHLAIDYAAPTGTPIRTVGDGSIIKKKYDRANGNLLRIRHTNGYETTYIHMSKYAKGMQVGRRVAQGEVIGYVGSTGLATGPHLDFRMFKNGKPINPTTIKAIASKPVSKGNLIAFQAETVRLLTELSESSIQQANVENERKNLSQ
jgi:murein DD-endopeptidase MepM/ murein hydrolase activator NlpD